MCATLLLVTLPLVGCKLQTSHAKTTADSISGACNKEIDKRTSVISVMYSTVVDVLTDLMSELLDHALG